MQEKRAEKESRGEGDPRYLKIVNRQEFYAQSALDSSTT